MTNLFLLFLFLLLYILPPLFQLLFGTLVITNKFNSKIKLWHVCVGSLLLLIISVGVHFYFATGVKDGLASLGIVMIDALSLLGTLVIVIIQIIVGKYRLRKIKKA